MTKQRDTGNGIGNMATARDRSCHFQRIRGLFKNNMDFCSQMLPGTCIA